MFFEEVTFKIMKQQTNKKEAIPVLSEACTSDIYKKIINDAILLRTLNKVRHLWDDTCVWRGCWRALLGK